jgi:hypothetical protein
MGWLAQGTGADDSSMECVLFLISLDDRNSLGYFCVQAGTFGPDWAMGVRYRLQ